MTDTSFLLHELAETKDALTRERRRSRSLRRSRARWRTLAELTSRELTEAYRGSQGYPRCRFCGNFGCGVHGDLEGLA